MNNDSLEISNRYKLNINQTFVLQESFSDLYKNNTIAELQEWYDYDVQVLNNLLVQEGLGDMIKKAGQKIGGAISGVGDFAMKKLATALGKLLKMAMPSEEEAQKLAQGAEKLKTDKNFQDQQAAAGGKLLGTGGGESEASEEMYESTRKFLLSTVFSESNLVELFNTQLVLEARTKAGRPEGKKNKKGATGKVNVAGGVQKANMAALNPAIMELISVVQQMKGGRQKQALNRIARTIAKKTKLNFPIPFPKADKVIAQQVPPDQLQNGDQQQQGGQLATQKQGGQLATQQDNQLATSQDGQIATQQGKGKAGNEPIDVDFTEIPNDQQALPAGQQDTKSLFQKVMGYVKAHPRITSSVAIAIIAAITAASGGTLLPLVVAGLSSGGIKAGVTAYQTNKEEGKVNWDKTVDSLFKGAAIGAGGAAIGQGVKGLMGAGSPDQTGGLGAKDAAEAQADPDTHEAQYHGDTHDGGLGAKDAAEAQADTETNAAQYSQSVEISNDQFKQYNATDFNPKSAMDQAKKQIMQKLSDANNGEIPASQYNDLAKKAAQLIKRGAKSNDAVSQLFPESYTVNYLRFF